MNSHLNQKGYALLIVLFLIVLTMTVTAVFIRGSISNAKQENRIDENQLSVTAAEMGVEYYSGLYNNIFISEREEIWNKEFALFLIEKDRIKNDRNIINKEMKIREKADYYQNEVFKKIHDRLKQMDVSSPTSNVIFSLQAEPIIERSVDSTAKLFIEVFATVKGKYKDDAETELAMKLLLFIPNMLDGEGVDIGTGNHDSFVLLQAQVIDRIKTNENCETGQRYQQLNLVKVQCADKNFSGEQIQQNQIVDIGTNYKFVAKQVEQNYKNLSLSSGNDFVAEQIQQNVNVKIQSGGSLSAKQIQQNKGINIHANKSFTSEQINDNSNFLTITSLDNIQTKQIQQNHNSSFKTNNNFTSEQIRQNTGFFKIEAGGDFESAQIRHNNGPSLIQVEGQFDSKHIQHNKDMTIAVGSNFSADQLQHNDNLSILIRGNYESKHVQHNTNLKIVVQGNLDTDKLDLKSGSLICVGGVISAKSIEKDSSSRIYILKKGNETDNGNFTFLESAEWSSVCGVNSTKYNVIWQNPVIHVDY